jgi:hypothetical protein
MNRLRSSIEQRFASRRARRRLVIAWSAVLVATAVLLLAAWIVADASATRVVSSSVADWIMADAMFVMIALALFLPSAVMAWHSEDEVDEVEVEA